MEKATTKKKIVLYTVASILFAITFFPFYIMLVSTFKYQMQIYENPWVFTFPLHVDNYLIAFIKIVKPIFNSLVVTSSGLAIVIVTSTMAAFSFARFKFPGKEFLYNSIIVLLMIPGFVMLIPQFVQIKNMGLYNTYLGQAIPPAANFSALGIMLMRTFFQGLPKSLFEAAEIEGVGEVTILSRIVIPLSLPIIATVSVMTGLAIWNNFVWSLVVTSGNKVKPVIIAITNLAGDANRGSGVTLAGYVVASLPILIVFFLATKPFVSGLTAGAVKG